MSDDLRKKRFRVTIEIVMGFDDEAGAMAAAELIRATASTIADYTEAPGRFGADISERAPEPDPKPRRPIDPHAN